MASEYIYSQTFLSLAKKFIAIQSTADNPRELREALGFCKNLIKSIPDFHIRELSKENKPTLIATYKGTKTPTFLFNGHVDVVPAPVQLFSLKKKGGKLIGRGVWDMKLAILAFIQLLKEVPQESLRHVGIMLVTDEEIWGKNGTYAWVKAGYKPKFFLTGEPSNLQLLTQGKGALWLEISMKGKAVHSAVPWNGENAIVLLQKKLHNFLLKHPVPNKFTWNTTYNVSTIQGGSLMNAVADNCAVGLDIRHHPDDDPELIIAQVKKAFHPASVKILERNAPVVNNDNNPYIRNLARAYESAMRKKAVFGKNVGTTDARFYSAIGVPSISFGPVGMGAHSNHEYVEIKSINYYNRVLKEFILSLANV